MAKGQLFAGHEDGTRIQGWVSIYVHMSPLRCRKERAVGSGVLAGARVEWSWPSLHNVLLQNSQASGKSGLELGLPGYYESVFIKVGGYDVF